LYLERGEEEGCERERVREEIKQKVGQAAASGEGKARKGKCNEWVE
jgi:hypothetical protein